VHEASVSSEEVARILGIPRVLEIQDPLSQFRQVVVEMLEGSLENLAVARIGSAFEVAQHTVRDICKLSRWRMRSASTALIDFARAAWRRDSSLDSIWDSTDLLSQPRAIYL